MFILWGSHSGVHTLVFILWLSHSGVHTLVFTLVFILWGSHSGVHTLVDLPQEAAIFEMKNVSDLNKTVTSVVIIFPSPVFSS